MQGKKKRRTVDPVVMQRADALRRARGESVRHIAQSLGLAYSFTYNLLHGKTTPSAETIKLLAVHLNTTTDYLFGLTDEPSLDWQNKGLQRLFQTTRGLREQDLEKVNRVVEVMATMARKAKNNPEGG